MWDDSAQTFFQFFFLFAGAVPAWAGSPLFDVVLPAFPLPTTASPTLQGTLKDGFREVFVACDMPEPCKFPSLDSSCQRRFQWIHKEAYLVLHPVIGRVLQVGVLQAG